MARIYNYLLEDRDRSERLTSPEAAVLKAWCVMAVSADRPFFSEDGPMVQFYSYPADPLNEDPLPVGRNSRAVKKSAHSPAKEEMPSYLEEAENYEIITGPDGKERIKLGEYPAGTPIVWLILEKKNKELLLMSEFALDAVPFSGFDHVTNEWHDSSLRAWLNDDFYGEAFSGREKKMILEDKFETTN